MKKSVALADRLSSLSLWLIALTNVLFLLAFIATLLVSAGKAQAAAPVCKGIDMIAEMATKDPQGLERIRAEAAATPNGSGRLWKIEKEGTAPSFLFGTLHMTDPRVLTLPPAAEQAFDQAATVVIETTDVLDPAKMAAGLLANPGLTMFTDQTTLTSLLPEADRPMVEAALKARGIPLGSVNKMKPWVLASMVSLPACELARKAAGEPVLDMNLANRAKAAGKAVGGLETAQSQLEAMASLPIAFHVEGLVETLRLGERSDDVIETMIQLYIAGETGMVWPFFHAVLPSDKGGGYAEFEEKMISARNVTMASSAERFLKAGNAFIAVGALHVPGEQGLVELLRRDGYTVTRVE